jgi:hypothetical protein
MRWPWIRLQEENWDLKVELHSAWEEIKMLRGALAAISNAVQATCASPSLKPSTTTISKTGAPAAGESTKQ